LAIVLSVLRWFMASDYPFGTFKLFLLEISDIWYTIYFKVGFERLVYYPPSDMTIISNHQNSKHDDVPNIMWTCQLCIR
jgi:hypothetical protein